MCLSTINKRLSEPKRMQFYKVMYRIRRKGDCNLYRFKIRKDCKPVVKGPEYKASVGYIDIDTLACVRYPAGYHGYTNLRQAQRAGRISRWERRWNCRNFYQGKGYPVVILCEGLVHTIGNDKGRRTVVARTMKILREIPLTQLFPKRKAT